jgi:hypothetical protein
MRNGFSLWVRALGGVDWWKNQRSKISRHCPFKEDFFNPEETLYFLQISKIENRTHPNRLRKPVDIPLFIIIAGISSSILAIIVAIPIAITHIARARQASCKQKETDQSYFLYGRFLFGQILFGHFSYDHFLYCRFLYGHFSYGSLFIQVACYTGPFLFLSFCIWSFLYGRFYSRFLYVSVDTLTTQDRTNPESWTEQTKPS